MTSNPISRNLTGGFQLSSKFIGPLNSAILFALTFIDLLAPALDKVTSKIIGIVMGAIVLLILNKINIAHQKQIAEEFPEPIVKIFFRDRSNFFTALLLPIAAIFFWYNIAHAESNGAIGDNIPGVKGLQSTLLGIKSDTNQIREDVASINTALNPTDARGRLTKLGYGLDDESKARAIESGDLTALQLYVEAKERLPLGTPVMGQRGGSNLEKPIMSRNPNTSKVIEILAKQGADLNQRYMLTFTQAQTGEIPKFNQLIAKLPPSQRFGISPSIVKANALVLAIWSKNDDAVKTLLALGASKDVGVDVQVPEVRNGTNTGQMITKQLSSAQAEATRLVQRLP